jgi:hypothetical protein
MSSTGAPRTRRHATGRLARAGTVTVTAILAAVLVAGCGGSDTTSQVDGRGGTELAVIRPHTPQASSRPHLAGAGATGAVAAGRRVQKARFPGGREDEEGTGGARPLKACSLVTRAEATAITGRPMAAVVEAPQGPTCIFEPRGAKRYITLSLQTGTFAALKRHVRVLRRGTARGRRAYCVRFGNVSTYVPLAGGRMLAVGAPCAVGERMAARALTRLPG